MSALPSHVVGHRETMRAKKAAQQENADRVWTQVEAERRALDERTAKLRALRLAREGAES
ncbi:hypothetical protein JOE48_001912 [Methylobacterium sp. PvR107]|nr:hypothetical protein [Methylobacterium sp. PvR107]